MNEAPYWRVASRARGVLLAIFVQFMFFWGYIVVSIMTRRAVPSSFFIDSLPTLLGVEMTFLNLGIITWLVAFAALTLYGYLHGSILTDEMELLPHLCPDCVADMETDDELPQPPHGKHPSQGGMYGREVA